MEQVDASIARYLRALDRADREPPAESPQTFGSSAARVLGRYSNRRTSANICACPSGAMVSVGLAPTSPPQCADPTAVLTGCAVADGRAAGRSSGPGTANPFPPGRDLVAPVHARREMERPNAGAGQARLVLGMLSTTYYAARVVAAATASISISHAELTSAFTMIVAEPGRASPKCVARAAPAAATSSVRTR
jgi:hypothetical protein